MQKRMYRTLFGILIITCLATFSYAASNTDTETASPATTVEKKKKKKKPFPAQENLLDINTATAEQLKTLPGLNDGDVQKIIAGRPYARKSQLKQKKIISAATYDSIKSAIVAKKPSK